jgi:predicted nuclease with TOPRIM domain
LITPERNWSVQEQLKRRLEGLKKEFETGQARLRELETEQTYVRETLLRISGAIQVLEETLADGRASGETAPAPETTE